MKKIIIYTDGASRDNPGEAAIGAVFCNEKGDIIRRHCQYLGEKITNNEAEYMAVILALKKFNALFGKKLAQKTEVEIRSDSELLVRQINGEYKVLKPEIQDLFIQIWNLKTGFKAVKFKLIAREKNQEADKLANEALNEKGNSLF